MKRLKRVFSVTALASLLALGFSNWPAPANAATAPKRLRAYQWAGAQKGKPYTWGGTGPYGYDCSGLVYAAYRSAGISLPRDTYSMLADVASGKLVWERTPRRGDLAFYGSGHVEIYDRANITYGALESGTPVWWHRWGGSWVPSAYFRVAGAG